MALSTLRVAAVQLAAHDRTDFEHRRTAIFDRVDAAARMARLVVLPEATLPAYVMGKQAYDGQATTLGLQTLAQIARTRGATIIVGAVLAHEGRLSNAAVAVDVDGRIAGQAAKFFLWHFDRQWFVAGEHLAPIATSLGPLGALVCADGRIPTIAATLVRKGACVLTMPTAWVTGGRDPKHLENVQADLLAQVRAYENRRPFIAANKCGSEAGIALYCGKSQIIDSDGAILSRAAEAAAQIIHATVTLRETSISPESTTYKLDAVPDPPMQPFRLAVCADPSIEPDLAEWLEVDAAFTVEANASALEIRARLPVIDCDDRVAFDPNLLAQARLRGYRLAIWQGEMLDVAWLERLARARALELHMYLLVREGTGDRAYVVDPDGALLCGTTAQYRIATCMIDLRKTDATQVAPGSDILDGLRRANGVA